MHPWGVALSEFDSSPAPLPLDAGQRGWRYLHISYKTHFVIVDAVGVVEQEKADTQMLERKRTVPFDKLLESVAWGAHDADTLTSLAGRLARLERALTEADRAEIAVLTGGRTLRDLANALLDAVDPDIVAGQPQGIAPTDAGDVGAGLAPALMGDREGAPLQAEWIERATAPFDNPQLRSTVIAIHRRAEQVIDCVSIDRVTEAAYSPEATERARATVESFRQFIETHRDEITALQMIYGRPYAQRRLTFAQVKELADRLVTTQPNWTTESLWWAYVQLEKDKVSGAATQRVLTDLVSLVRHAVQLDDELVPYPRLVKQRYESWLADQEAAGRKFTATQRWWLDKIAEHIGVNLAMTEDDFGIGEFFDRGGQIAARKQFGRVLPALLDELNAALVA
jgi:type I restriction enzyme, R subunit